MTKATGRKLGWSGFIFVGLLAAAGPFPVQLAFAGAAILVFGTLHGGSDLAVAPRGAWPALLAFYGAAVFVTLLWWRVAPVSALGAFLLLSAVHFGRDDAPPSRVAERWCRGALMVGGPALLHAPTLAALFASLTGAAAAAMLLAMLLRLAAVAALVALPFAAAGRSRATQAGLAGGVAALVLLPPLVGFAVAFTVLHARPQLAARMAALGCARLPDYLRRTAPVLAGAAAVVATAGTLFFDGPAPALSTVFAGLAALATPHMLAPASWGPSGAPRPLPLRAATD